MDTHSNNSTDDWREEMSKMSEINVVRMGRVATALALLGSAPAVLGAEVEGMDRGGRVGHRAHAHDKLGQLACTQESLARLDAVAVAPYRLDPDDVDVNYLVATQRPR